MIKIHVNGGLWSLLDKVSQMTECPSVLSVRVPRVPWCLKWQNTQVPTEFLQRTYRVQIVQNFGFLFVRINIFVRNVALTHN